MSKSKAEKEREKVIQDRCQILLNKMLKEEDNKYCVDCDSKGPRWASWNIGVFLCIRCAGIHRNLGVHISKVRSVNLDSWTPQQVSSMQNMGNSRGRAVFEANVPNDYRRPNSDSAMEAFIRNKYEKKKFIAKEWVPTKPPDLPVGWAALIEAEKLGKMKDVKVTTTASVPVNNNNNNTTTKPTSKATDEWPTSSLPTSSQLVQSSTPTSAPVHTPSSSSVDLLGLSVGQPTTTPASSNSLDDDLFSNFVSATCDSSKQPESGGTQPDPTPASSQENDFFNQVASSDTTAAVGASDASKMSNSSILALFASGNKSQPLPGPQGGVGGNFQQGHGLPVQTSAQQMFGGSQAANPFQDMIASVPGSAPNQPRMNNSMPPNVMQMNNQMAGLRLQGQQFPGIQINSPVAGHPQGAAGGNLPGANLSSPNPYGAFSSPQGAHLGYQGASPAFQNNLPTSPAFPNNQGATPAFQNNFGASPAFQNNFGASPAFQNNLGASPAFLNNQGASPAFQNNTGASPGFQNKGGASMAAFQNNFGGLMSAPSQSAPSPFQNNFSGAFPPQNGAPQNSSNNVGLSPSLWH